MNINSNAFYHKIFKFFDTNAPENLCPYARKLVMLWTFVIGSIAGISWMVAILGIGVIMLLGTLFGFDTSAWSSPSVLTSYTAFIGFLVGVTSFTAVGSMIYAGVVAHVKWVDFRRSKGKLSISERITASDNILVNYISAKHRKICPRLTFKEPK